MNRNEMKQTMQREMPFQGNTTDHFADICADNYFMRWHEQDMSQQRQLPNLTYNSHIPTCMFQPSFTQSLNISSPTNHNICSSMATTEDVFAPSVIRNAQRLSDPTFSTSSILHKGHLNLPKQITCSNSFNSTSSNIMDIVMKCQKEIDQNNELTISEEDDVSRPSSWPSCLQPPITREAHRTHSNEYYPYPNQNSTQYQEDDDYLEKRRKNNEASRRSRKTRRQKECEIKEEVKRLRTENINLKSELKKLRKLHEAKEKA